jgi:2-polyprenyl-6-methoxyphenol hydroxylase-like FAD-dependent oxidoreductase
VTVADVVIAGAGPNGLMLACELSLAGVHPVVLERLPEPSRENRANGLVGQVVRMLERRGLHQRLAGSSEPPQPNPVFAFAALPLNLSVLADNPLYLLEVPQTRIEEVLAERAAELGVEVRRGHELTGLSQHGDAVTAQIAGPHGRYELSGRYLVGADGGRSTVRKACGIGFPGATQDDVVSRMAHVSVPDELVDPDTGALHLPGHPPSPPWLYRRTEQGLTAGHYLRTERGMLAHGRLAGRPSLVYTVEWSSDGVDDAPVTLQEIARSVHRVVGAELPVEPPPGEGPHLLRRITGGNTRVADRYRDGRVLLVGDAAHVHSPIGGPGLNLGLQDAINLGWKLAATVQGWAPPGLLDSYDAERRPLGHRVAMQTQAQLALFAPGGEVTALRELLTELLHDPRNIAHIANLMAGADIRYEMGVRDTHHLVGRWAPDLVLDAGSERVRLAELTTTARPLLLDLTGDASLTSVAYGWRDRVDTVSARRRDGATTGLLLRPDCYVAWATDTPCPDHRDRESLRRALATWFGTARRPHPGRIAVTGC